MGCYWFISVVLRLLLSYGKVDDLLSENVVGICIEKLSGTFDHPKMSEWF